MNASEPSVPSAIGFISVLSCEPHGWVSGYLIVNSQGRPLEFHCTVPVTPSRAQEILYGATFAGFFFGELLGQSLLKRGTSQPELVLTNHRDTLAAREFHDTPMLYLIRETDTITTPEDRGPLRLQAHADYPHDLAIGQALIDRLPPSWEVAEPFERIEQAVREAQRAA